ncbi:hypothetical protein GCM10009601_34150 [Streptomyces thermospinosisporus]|uniref:DUF3592 domain-containing protein n=1 Tax=Streptomyces thermospinosisporus TaxID=161482 RepID=A0ABP4JP48_9ACTN
MRKTVRVWQAALPVGIGLVVLLVCAWLFSTVPDHQAEERAYRAARPVSVPARVEAKVDEVWGKSTRHWLHVTERGSERRLRMSDVGDDIYGRVRPGDRVTVEYWRGEIRAVTFDGVTQQTHESPIGDWRMPLGIGLGLVPVGVLLVWTGWYYRYRYPTAPKGRHTLMPGAVWAAGLMEGTIAFLASGADTVRDALLVAACGIPPSAAIGALTFWLVWRRIRKADDTSDIVPVVPASRITVSATVHGDVPYSRYGCNLLVLGDGPPATTPDPAGRVARVELPDTLTVERVRGWRLGEDPDAWPGAYKYNGVVIECRDGEKQVLIASRRRDAPVILGVLLNRAAAGEAVQT